MATKRTRRVLRKGPNRQIGIKRKIKTDSWGEATQNWHKKVISSGKTKYTRSAGAAHSRPPRGSKKTTVGKGKRKYPQRGSYSTHGRR